MLIRYRLGHPADEPIPAGVALSSASFLGDRAPETIAGNCNFPLGEPLSSRLKFGRLN
jgi:hypothetical protein